MVLFVYKELAALVDRKYFIIDALIIAHKVATETGSYVILKDKK